MTINDTKWPSHPTTLLCVFPNPNPDPNSSVFANPHPDPNSCVLPNPNPGPQRRRGAGVPEGRPGPGDVRRQLLQDQEQEEHGPVAERGRPGPQHLREC